MYIWREIGSGVEAFHAVVYSPVLLPQFSLNVGFDYFGVASEFKAEVAFVLLCSRY